MKRQFTFAIVLLCCLTSILHANDTDVLNQKIISLLEEYSPNGIKIVEMAMQAQNEMNTLNLSKHLVFEPYTEPNIVMSLPVVVHESHHFLEINGQEVVYNFSGRGDISFQNNFFYLADGDYGLVKKTETFPSRELESLFPDTLQSRFLFFPYVTETRDIVSTQQSGIFGLLSEFNAYYYSARIAADMFPYYEKWGADAKWQRFLIDITFDLYACQEFKYYILTYLNFAEKHHPKIYNDLIHHKPFIYTFFEIDRLINELFAYYLEGRPHVFELLKSYGWNAWVDDHFLYIEKNGKTKKWEHLIDAGEELDSWMHEGDYVRQLNVMEAEIAGWDRNIFWKDLEAMTLQLPDNAKPVRNAWKPFKKLHAVIDDPVEDVAFPFIDFSRAGVALNPDGSMWIHMEMQDIPEKLPCDQPGVRPNEFEYEWTIHFAVLGDTAHHYLINLYEYYANGPHIQNIMQECVTGVYDDALLEDILIEGRQVGNTLILNVKPNPYFQVPRDNVRIYFETLYNNGTQKTHDYLPDYRMKNTLILDYPRY